MIEKNNLNYCPKDDQREGPVAAPTQDCSRTEPADARGNQRAIAEEFGLVIPGERDVLSYVRGSESNKKVPAIKKKRRV